MSLPLTVSPIVSRWSPSPGPSWAVTHQIRIVRPDLFTHTYKNNDSNHDPTRSQGRLESVCSNVSAVCPPDSSTPFLSIPLYWDRFPVCPIAPIPVRSARNRSRQTQARPTTEIKAIYLWDSLHDFPIKKNLPTLVHVGRFR